MQLGVGGGDVVGLTEPQPPGGVIDPPRRPFEFEERSDRRLVEHRPARADRSEACPTVLYILSAVFLIPERRLVAQALQDLGESLWAPQLGLYFPANLMFAWFSRPLERDQALCSCGPKPEEQSAAPQRLPGRVKNDIPLENPPPGYPKPSLPEPAPSLGGVRKPQLNLDFPLRSRLHAHSLATFGTTVAS